MDDIRKWTDEQLEEIEREMARIYRDSRKNLMKDWMKFMDQSAKRIERYEDSYAEAVASGDKKAIKESETALKEAKKRETLQSDRYRKMVDNITQNLAEINQEALDVVNQRMPSIYAGNFNDAGIDAKNLGLDFSLVNEDAVRNLTNELPNKVVQIAKDRAWNNKGITSGVLQGIIQGDSMPEIAKRLETVFNNNYNSAIRNARTMVTQAENLGHLDGYKRLADMGVVSKKEWIAVGDSRTRDWHLSMDGQQKELDEPFIDGIGNKLDYPADPDAPAETVYNCRCGTKDVILGFRKADGTIEYIEYDRSMDEESLHDIQIRMERERRATISAEKEAKSQKQAQKEVLHGDQLSYNMLQERAERRNITHNEVKEFKKALSENEIIERISGGDMTKGSCSSLALTYCANKNGLDVLDFRDGESRSLFAKTVNIPLAYRSANAEIIDFSVKKEARDVAKIIKDIDDNREYVLVAGKHASVIRKFDGELKYLELQSSQQNGWKPFEYTVKTSWSEYSQTIEDTLKNRFGCRKTVDKDKWTGYVYERKGFLVPVDSVQNTEEFRSIMGYINTDIENQKKGLFGSVK